MKCDVALVAAPILPPPEYLDYQQEYPYYANCMQCHEPMIGIKDISARQVCKPCGGIAVQAVVNKKTMEELRRELKEMPRRRRRDRMPASAPTGGTAA